MQNLFYKARPLIILVTIALIHFPLSGYAERAEEVYAIARTYDYSDTWNYGAAYNWAYDEKKATIDSMDVDYVGMSENEKESLRSEPEKWRKFWLRVDISPAVDPKALSSEIAGDHFLPMNLYGQTMTVSNVRIENSEEIRFYPKAEMLMSADYYRIRDYEQEEYGWFFYNAFLDAENDIANERSTIYWKEKKENTCNEWILEMAGYVGNMEDMKVETAMRKIEMRFGVEIDETGGEKKAQECAVQMDKLRRETRYYEGGVKVRGEYFWRQEGNIASSFENYPPTYIGAETDSIVRECIQYPERYTIFSFWLTLEKDMPWGITGTRLFLRKQQSDLWIEMEERYDNMNDLWPNGMYGLNHMTFLMRTEGKTDGEVAKALNEIELIFEFSTEFAGENLWSGLDHIGNPGPRFSVGVNMSEILTSEQMQELIGTSDG